MKPVTRNILLGGFLLGAASLATAQNVSVSGNINAIAPLAVTNVASGTIIYGDDFSGNGRTFKDGDLKTKEVSKEIDAPKGSDIYIENASRAIIVKTWEQQKVKVTTTVYYDGDASKLTDDEWLEKVNLSLKTLGSSVKIKSGGVGSGSNTFYSYNGSGSFSSAQGSSSGVAIFNGNGQNIGTKTNIKRVVTITVPAGSKLDIESKYADVTLAANVGDVNVDITNGNLEAENLNKFILRSKYSNINVGDIKTAEVEFTNGRFSAKNVGDLDIDSKYSTIEMAAAKKMVIRSTNDEYEVEDAGEVRGRKTYGNLRITKLNNSLEIDGTNADVKIRNVGPSLSLIKIDDKYADVRIPLRDTKNYSLDFSGAYSSVYGNFEKKPVTAADKDKDDKAAPSVNAITIDGRNYASGTRSYAVGSNWNESSPSRFTATVGDGKGLKVDLKCQNCTVDFK